VEITVEATGARAAMPRPRMAGHAGKWPDAITHLVDQLGKRFAQPGPGSRWCWGSPPASIPRIEIALNSGRDRRQAFRFFCLRHRGTCVCQTGATRSTARGRYIDPRA